MSHTKDQNTAKRVAANGLLLALALILHFVENLLPPVVPLPGVKPGLANIVTVYALFRMGPYDAVMILLGRIVLGSIFGGQMVSFWFSLCGGLFSFCGLLLLRRILSDKQLWVSGVIGALLHNAGQMAVACFVYGSPAVLAYYIPVLTLSGIVTGVFTGLCAQGLLRYVKQGTGQ